MGEHRVYRPSNSDDGLGFEMQFCDRCERDQKFRETEDGRDGCEIHTRAYLFNYEDPEYPKEWTYDAAGKPTCTAFEEEVTEAERERRAVIAAGQKDLFGETKQG